jgi:hypothetical protein
MDGGRFRNEPWMASPKMPAQRDAGAGALWIGAFFGYFLCTSKESNSPLGESF